MIIELFEILIEYEQDREICFFFNHAEKCTVQIIIIIGGK